jgi:hypothetical protein
MRGRRPGTLEALSDDQLGTIAVSLVVSELRWTPDVAPAVMDRISRDAVAYPEQFHRRPLPDGSRPGSPPDEPSAARTILRVVVMATIVVLVAALVLVAATTNAASVGAPSVDAAWIGAAMRGAPAAIHSVLEVA